MSHGPVRVLGEALTKAGEALAMGSDEAHLHDAAEQMARALGATTVAVLATVREGESLHVIADSDQHRSDAGFATLLAAPSLREAMLSAEVVVAAEPDPGLSEPIPDLRAIPQDGQNGQDGQDGLPGQTLVPATNAGEAPGPRLGTWAIFPVIVRRKTRGVLVARLPYLATQLSDSVLLCGRAAAALIAVVLPGAKVLEPLRDRTRKTTLTDVHRERRLRAIERYRAFIDSASDGIVVLDRTGTVLYMNRAAEQVTGYARDGLAGRSWAQIVPEGQRETLWTQLSLATQSRPVENFDLDLVTTSGDRITVSVASIGILAEHGAAIFAFRDVTLARELEIELRRTTEFLERILNSAVDGIIAADMRGTVLLFNHSAERICGYRAAEVIGKMSVTEVYPPGVAQEIMRLLRSSQRGGGGRLEPVRRELKSATGELIPVSISAALVFDDAGREIATVGIFSDLRERLRMEERLATAQEKLAISEKQVVAIELAGAAAHELNQPLTSVMGYAQIMMRKMDPESPHFRALETILNESERMAAIVRQLGSLTRYETKSYVGGAQIIDLDRSAETPDE
ncbi:MAG: PAS domain S-box protein [Myxococcales bacterium]